MIKYILKRLLMMIPVLLGVALVVFTMMYITPGDPARSILGPEATEEAVAELQEEMGLNDGYWVRFGRYVWDALHGDLGISYVTKMPVTEELMARFPTTVVYALLCTLVAMLIGIPLGILSAVKQNTLIDSIARIVAMIGVAMPTFWLGLMLILVFSVQLKWFPSSGFYGPIYWVLPAVTVGFNTAATIMRMTRSSMLEVIRQDYIRTARAKGQRESIIIVRHALKNAMIPILTVVGMRFGAAMGGAVISEQIFSIPGMGKLMVDAIKNRNYPMVQGGVLFIALAFSIVNLIVDVLYAFVDPRLKSQFNQGKKRRAKDIKGGADA